MSAIIGDRVEFHRIRSIRFFPQRAQYQPAASDFPVVQGINDSRTGPEDQMKLIGKDRKRQLIDTKTSGQPDEDPNVSGAAAKAIDRIKSEAKSLIPDLQRSHDEATLRCWAIRRVPHLFGSRPSASI